MKTENPDWIKILKSIIALFLVVFLGVSFFSACSSAGAEKKDKSKKSKAKRDEAIEDEENTESETDSKPANSKEEDQNSSSEKENKSANKKEEKKSDDKDEKKSSDKENSDKNKSEKKVSADMIWNDLIKGNKRFMAGKHTTVNYSTSRISLSKGQTPQVIILGCADSRVPPEFVFDKNLGELFVVRDAGNIADEVSLGSIEYAVEHLHAKMIVVLGHESCGAVAAAVSGEKMPSRNLSAITNSITPAFEDSKTCIVGGQPNISCVELNAEHSAEDLLLKSSIIKKAVEAGEVSIVSAVYHFDSGEVVRLK